MTPWTNKDEDMRLTVLITLTLLAAIGPSYAQQQEKASLTYAALLSRLEQHPALEAVRQQVIEQQEAADGAGSLPDPMLMFGINNYPADGEGGFDRFAMTSKSVGIVQQIPNSGIRAASVAARQHLSAKAGIAVAFTHQQLVAALNTALAGRTRVTHQRDLINRDIKLLKQEAAYWDGRLRSGDSALDERSRVEAELAQAEARLATLQAEDVQFVEELQRLIQRTDDVTLPPMLPLPWPNTESVYPVLLAEKDVQVARANVEGAESAFNPNYQVGLSYAQRENSGNFDGGDFVSAQLGVSIPLWASWSQAPKLRSAQAGVSRAQALLGDIESQWRQKLATQFAKVRETEATQKALREKEKSIETQISSLRSAYESDGRLDILIAAKRSLLGLQIQLVELEARYVGQVSSYNAFFLNSSLMPESDLKKPQDTPQLSTTREHNTQPIETGENL
jgi:outer membrane protein TolC